MMLFRIYKSGLFKNEAGFHVNNSDLVSAEHVDESGRQEERIKHGD